VKRIVSIFFHFAVTREGVEPNGANLAEYLRNETDFLSDYYLKYLSHTEYWFTKQKLDPVVIVNNILKDFDFVAVTERMDESAVALSMILDLPLSDVMYLPAKVHGSSYDDQPPCDMIKPSFVSPDMKRVLDTFSNMTYWDTVLYEAASRSLDLTIDRLGREEFEKRLDVYRRAQRLGADRCFARTVFPCSGGTFHFPNQTNCMWKDSACGSSCLDEVATELGMMS